MAATVETQAIAGITLVAGVPLVLDIPFAKSAMLSHVAFTRSDGGVTGNLTLALYSRYEAAQLLVTPAVETNDSQGVRIVPSTAVTPFRADLPPELFRVSPLLAGSLGTLLWWADIGYPFSAKYDQSNDPTGRFWNRIFARLTSSVNGVFGLSIVGLRSRDE